SIEYTIIDLYGTITKTGALKAADQQMVDRFVADHKQAAAKVSALTKTAGAQPYECVNSWYEARVIPPIWIAINGDKTTGVPRTDTPARDMLSTVNAFESMAGAMYQQWVQLLITPELRSEMMLIGAVAARQAAVSALRSNPPPDGYISPIVLGPNGPTPT